MHAPRRLLSLTHHLVRSAASAPPAAPARLRSRLMSKSPPSQIGSGMHTTAGLPAGATPTTGATPFAGSSAPADTSAETPAAAAPPPTFAVSPVPPNPLGEGRYIRTAAALIIGDEILNGKTHDRNSHYFARFCFAHGIQLKRIEVIADDQDEIIEASRRLVHQYDLVVTSGGIGPTHDDITYAALAAAFDQPLVHHEETLTRMAALSRLRGVPQDAAQRTAMQRMALFPAHAEVLFIAPTIWVPVVRLAGRLCVFPGIPQLFERMLDGLAPLLALPPASARPQRLQVFTARQESLIAPFLTELQKRVAGEGIQVGSYPVLMQGVFVSLIGRDAARVQAVGEEVARGVDGRIVSEEEVARTKESAAEELVARQRKRAEGA